MSTPSLQKRPLEPSDGTHVVGIYTVESDMLDAIIPFFADGLRGHDKCFYAAPTETLDVVRQALRQLDIEVDAKEESGQLALVDQKEPLLDNGRFDPAFLVNLYRADVDAAIKSGWNHVRATAEMSWLIDGVAGREEILYYEALSTQLFNRTDKVHALCQYNTARMQGKEIIELLKIHPWAMVDGRIGENPFWIDPEPESYRT